MQGQESLTSEIGKRFKPASPESFPSPTTGAVWGMSGALQWFSLVVWFFCLFLFGGVGFLFGFGFGLEVVFCCCWLVGLVLILVLAFSAFSPGSRLLSWSRCEASFKCGQ